MPNNGMPEEEHHQVHNCFVVLADMGEMVPEAASNIGASNGASTSGAQAPVGLGSRGPFSFGGPGMPPFVFGSIINPGQDLGVFGGPRPSQPGEPPGEPPASSFASFNMGQSLLFRMAPGTASAVESLSTGMAESLTASNRRIDAPVPSEGQRSRLRQRLGANDVAPFPLGRSWAGRDRDRGLFTSFQNQRPQAADGLLNPDRQGLPAGIVNLTSAFGTRQTSSQPTSAVPGAAAGQPGAAGEGQDGPSGGPEAGHPLDQILQRAFSNISAEAFITDFVRQAIEASRYRGNPPASQFGIDNLKETSLLEASCEACTVCQDALEQGALTLTMPCGHDFHKECLMPWLSEHNTCPVCRCEIESHCPRYNQQNFDKLKGELGAETITRQKNGEPPMPEPTRVVHTQGRWLSGPDIQTETTPMPGGGGTRSLRMTVRMPVGTLSALVSLSGVSPHDALSSLRSAHASFPATDSPAMQHPAVPPRAPAVPPRETQSLDDVAAQSLGHHTHARVGQATTQSSGQTPRVDDPLHYSFLDPSLIRRMTQTQPIPSGTQQPSHVAEAGAAVDNKDASAPECRHTPADDGSSPQSTDSRRQTVRSRRRTFEENEAAPLTASRRSAAKRPRTGDTQASDLPDLNLAGADASCGTSGTDAPISSRTRKRN